LDWDFLAVVGHHLDHNLQEVAAAVPVVLVIRPDLILLDQEVREFLIRLLEVMLLIVPVVLAGQAFLVRLAHMVLGQHKASSSFVIQHKKEKIICL
jgi:hypothetical protein